MDPYLEVMSFLIKVKILWEQPQAEADRGWPAHKQGGQGSECHFYSPDLDFGFLHGFLESNSNCNSSSPGRHTKAWDNFGDYFRAGECSWARKRTQSELYGICCLLKRSQERQSDFMAPPVPLSFLNQVPEGHRFHSNLGEVGTWWELELSCCFSSETATDFLQPRVEDLSKGHAILGEALLIVLPKRYLDTMEVVRGD